MVIVQLTMSSVSAYGSWSDKQLGVALAEMFRLASRTAAIEKRASIRSMLPSPVSAQHDDRV